MNVTYITYTWNNLSFLLVEGGPCDALKIILPWSQYSWHLHILFQLHVPPKPLLLWMRLISQSCFPESPIDNKSPLAHVMDRMDCGRIGNKLLAERMEIQLSDAYKRHQATVRWHGLFSSQCSHNTSHRPRSWTWVSCECDLSSHVYMQHAISYQECCARSRYQGQGQVITSHRYHGM